MLAGFFLRLCGFFPVFAQNSRRNAIAHLESFNKIGNILKAAFLTDLMNALFRGNQQFAGLFQPQRIQIFLKSHPHFLFKQRRYIAGRQPHMGSYRSQGDAGSVVCDDVGMNA
jgi:hypothetical protein